MQQQLRKGYSEDDIKEMEKLKEERDYSYREIGDKFGIGRMQVYRILKRAKIIATTTISGI